MEILEILDVLEDKVENAKNIPIINRAIIDKEDLLASIEDIRLRLPDDLKQARWIKDDRKRILAEAKEEADAIIKQGEEKAAQMVDEHAITKRAYEQANSIIASAQKNSRELRLGARQYIDKVLADSDAALAKSQETIRAMRVELRQDATKAVETTATAEEE
ncbi:MAG: ATPase [Clostridia bacterium]|nr:ATPase [Clostridia bacterium]